MEIPLVYYDTVFCCLPTLSSPWIHYDLIFFSVLFQFVAAVVSCAFKKCYFHIGMTGSTNWLLTWEIYRLHKRLYDCWRDICIVLICLEVWEQRQCSVYSLTFCRIFNNMATEKQVE